MGAGKADEATGGVLDQDEPCAPEVEEALACPYSTQPCFEEAQQDVNACCEEYGDDSPACGTACWANGRLVLEGTLVGFLHCIAGSWYDQSGCRTEAGELVPTDTFEDGQWCVDGQWYQQRGCEHPSPTISTIEEPGATLAGDVCVDGEWTPTGD